MKKLICALMCAVMLLGLMPSVFALKNGDVVDAVLHTDIVTYINTTSRATPPSRSRTLWNTASS